MINKKVILLFTHTIVLIMGFALGVYFLPILTAPKSLDVSIINEYEQKATYQTEFVKKLKGSDFLHWGEAKVTISDDKVTVNGSIAPGPDYKLYFTNQFVEHEDEFYPLRVRQSMLLKLKPSKILL